MKASTISYHFETKVWKHNAPASWYFVSVPKNLSNEIRSLFQDLEEGWGRMPCEAKVGNTLWKSAIWYDTKQQCYILPLKADIRKKEHIETEQDIVVTVYL